MLSLFGIWNSKVVHGKRGSQLPVVGEFIRPTRGVAKEFGLLWYHFDVIVSGIFTGKMKKTLELEGACAHKGDIICLTHTCNMDRANVNA